MLCSHEKALATNCKGLYRTQFVLLFFLLLVLEEVINLFVANHALVEGVSTSLGALYHLDNLGIATTIGLTGLESSGCFLCHSLLSKSWG